MSRPKTRRDDRTSLAAPRRRAPLNSVSTRIILCVFASTCLTALIVSWLSIGAIHKDVRNRTSTRIQEMLAERQADLVAWQASASAQLSASTAVGSRWHGALIGALDAMTSPAALEWITPRRDGESRLTATPGARPLPDPPRELAGPFERLRLRPAKADDGEAGGVADSEEDCIDVSAELVRASSEVAGTLEGCLSHDALIVLLTPRTNHERGTRLLFVDPTGRVVAATGSRSEARLGRALPIADLLYPARSRLADYRDQEGNRVVGSIVSLGRSGWYLVAEVEHARAFGDAIAITNQMFVVDVCIILLFSVLAYKITTAIMQPIEALSEGAQRISEGQVNYEIPMPAHDDELGLLTRTFNDMMRKLRSSQDEIEEDRVRLAEKNEELQRANEILSQLSITDGLTKLHNHRYFQDHLTREIKRVSRTSAPLSLILIDIDDFKLLNDTHGHAAGDEVLVSLAAIMNDSARESDLIARYGGEEFVILMPNTDLPGAVHLAEKIRMAVESTRLIIGEGLKPVEVTISCGVARYDGNRREFFAEADKALYQAKAAGKNCVVIGGSESGPAA